MLQNALPSALFTSNRDRLRARLLPASMAVLNANDIPPANGDGTTAAIPNSDLFYLTGIAQEQTILLLAPHAHDEKMREILFVRETSELLAQWEGHKLTKTGAQEASGIARVEWLSDFPGIFRKLMCEVENVYLNSNEHPRAVIEVESRDARFVRETMQAFPLHHFHRLARLLHELRTVKSEHEIGALRQAVALTTAGFERVLRFVRPGVNEREIQAEFAHEFIRQGGRMAYVPIIASGKNACVLHYLENNRRCESGALLLLDVGASLENYNADVTRTIPVNGRFSTRQRAVYEAVLRVLRKTIDALAPGKLAKDWQKDCEKFMEEELLQLGLLKTRDIKKQTLEQPALKKYFMHGCGHPLGLDVHDVATIGAPMAEGWVMTVEPGIYIPEEGFGIRLEDDVLITASGNVNLTADIPIEPGEIESAMKQRGVTRVKQAAGKRPR